MAPRLLVLLLVIDSLVEKQWLAHILDFGNGAFQVECFRKNDLENLVLLASVQFDWKSHYLYLLDVDAVTRAAEYQASSHSFCKSSCLLNISFSDSIEIRAGTADLRAYLFLVFLWKANKVVILRAYEEGNSRLVEPSSLTVPFFNAVQCALPCQVKHKEYSNSIVADQW
jgi:hypothetical protein